MALPNPAPPLLLTKRLSAFLHANQIPELPTLLLTTYHGKLLAHASPNPVSIIRTHATVAASLLAIHASCSPDVPYTLPGSENLDPAPSTPVPKPEPDNKKNKPVLNVEGIPKVFTVRRRTGPLVRPAVVTVQLSGGTIIVRRLQCGLLLVCVGPTARDVRPEPQSQQQGETSENVENNENVENIKNNENYQTNVENNQTDETNETNVENNKTNEANVSEEANVENNKTNETNVKNNEDTEDTEDTEDNTQNTRSVENTENVENVDTENTDNAKNTDNVDIENTENTENTDNVKNTENVDIENTENTENTDNVKNTENVDTEDTDTENVKNTENVDTENTENADNADNDQADRADLPGNPGSPSEAENPVSAESPTPSPVIVVAPSIAEMRERSAELADWLDDKLATLEVPEEFLGTSIGIS
ncbi:hypothetical protein E4U42_000795 [Claviceps africana]|uniref:Uncharacterized protein n=1 Tax=Claviceps africana TaxID=83212 RepID=A0A8K0J9X9_9HYPO|nr:hypothetical protein E4U42_000795 [Claviceps africana]